MSNAFRREVMVKLACAMIREGRNIHTLSDGTPDPQWLADKAFEIAEAIIRKDADND